MGATNAARHWPPQGDVTTVDQVDLLGYPDDAAVLPQLLGELATGSEFVIGYFGSVDTYSHVYGPDAPEALDAYRQVDKKVGEIDFALGPSWDESVVIVVSDHVLDTVDGPGIDLRTHLDDDLIIVDEGSAALVSGLRKPEVLSKIDGIEGWELLADGNVLAWCDRGRYFGPFESPLLKGAHGGANTRQQLALVTGGHPARARFAAAVADGPVSATFWAPEIAGAFGVR
jgi:hypothetical protein